MKIGDLVRLNEVGYKWYNPTADGVEPWNHIALIIGYDRGRDLPGWARGAWKVLCNETTDGEILVANEGYWEVINE